MSTIINGSSPSITFSDGSAQTSATRPFLNRIINGAMVLDQRNAGASVSIDGGASYTLDRYLCQDNTDGSYTVQQSSTAPVGFNKSMLVTITGTDSSLTTTQFGRIVQRIEGSNVSDLAWGTADAKTVTLSFWVRSSVTGTYSGTINNSDGNRYYGFAYTISSANTWEYKTITIVGDTTGTWLTTTGTGIELNLSIGAGPDRTITAGSWQTSTAYATTGQTNLFATNGATFFLTGVQLEVGSTATSFDYRPYGTELNLCLRYFENIDQLSLRGAADSTSAFIGNFTYVVEKRASPTATLLTTTPVISEIAVADRTASSATLIATTLTKKTLRSQITGFSGLTAKNPMIGAESGASNNVISLSAEL